ncbi:MAG: prolipoprotein diacylglyceryl transferase [Myxococcales bacterium]|nr:prolipoprotein diacylglyceryl transferase [Myxococcales bacterium]
MSGAALPYVVPPSGSLPLPGLGDQPLTIFGPLVLLGVIVGWRRGLRYAEVHGIGADAARTLMERVLVVGFVVAHWFSLVFYFPERIVADPWVLLWIPAGLSSVGGFLGAWLGLWWVTRRTGLPRLRCADLLTYGLLAGFCLGRLGCALVHDHPGRLASPDAWLAVGPWPGAGGQYRYDLGLLELGLCLGLLLAVHLGLDWRRAAPGRLTGLVAVGYAAVRFVLDFFRAVDAVGGGTPDPRYLGLTAAQHVTLVFLAAGAWLLLRREGASGAQPQGRGRVVGASRGALEDRS